MILKFATKRNQNGNRTYLGINTTTREYAREPQSWYCKEEIIEVSHKDLRKILQSCIDNNYSEITYM